MNFLTNALRQGLSRSVLRLGTTGTNNALLENQAVSQITKTFLQPVLPTLSFVSGFKVRYVVKRRCRDCYLVVRDGRMYNICPTHPRHKAKSMVPNPKKLRILTWAGQSKIRPW